MITPHTITHCWLIVQQSWNQQASPVQNVVHQSLLNLQTQSFYHFSSGKYKSKFVKIIVSPLILKLFIISSDRTAQSSNMLEKIPIHSWKSETKQTPQVAGHSFEDQCIKCILASDHERTGVAATDYKHLSLVSAQLHD